MKMKSRGWNQLGRFEKAFRCRKDKTLIRYRSRFQGDWKYFMEGGAGHVAQLQNQFALL